MRRWELGLVFLLSLLAYFPGLADAQTAISGQVSETTRQQGVGDLVVKVTPPKGSSEPQRITTTNPEGRFQVDNLKGKEYLLEVYQGLKPVYRAVVDPSLKAQQDIKVQAIQ